MEEIIRFFDEIFSKFVMDDEAYRLKSMLIENSGDKYESYISSGMQRDEAISKIKSEFGDIEELKREYGLKYVDENSMNRDVQDALDKKQKFDKKFSIYITSGVVLCIIGIMLAGIFSNGDFSESTMMIGFFVPVAIGVACFIYAGITQNSLNQNLKLQMKIAGIYDKEAGKIFSDDEEDDGNGWLYIVATVVFFIIGFSRGLWHPGWIVFVIAAAIDEILKTIKKNRAHN